MTKGVVPVLDNVTTKLRQYPKTCGGIGILTAFGLLLYEKRKIQQFLSKFVHTSPTESEQKKKRPEYIYIRYHIYKESMRKLKEREEQDKKWISVIINPIGKWWKAVKHSVAWRLLRIAQTGTQSERLKAVHQLARIDHLKDWDFRHLAQICDDRTAISLARSGADKRWFLQAQMHGCIKNPKYALADLHGMLEKLKPNPCVQHFFVKYFPDQNPLDRDIDEFFAQDEPIQLSVQDTDLLKEIISFLHHITKETKVAERIVADGGLVHLMELRKIFANDNETLSTLCKVLANLSLVDDCEYHFVRSGWVRTLAEWQTCADLRLQVISAKVMANLDHDDPNHVEYAPNVYPLYPRRRMRTKPKADIVFIHGLLGGVFITWRQKDRQSTELSLYGRNAFYTNNDDDVFLVGEQQRYITRKNKNGNATNNKNGEATKATESVTKEDGSILKTATKPPTKQMEISDMNTLEIVENLQNEAELDPDWEVVHPDVPLKANEGCKGEFSVPGNMWQNQDSSEEYTNCWPMEWLPEDYPNMRVIGIDYTSAVTEWSANFTKYCPCEKGQGHIELRSSSLLERIARADVGNNRPVVWIGHSMGGILTKLILMKANEHDDPQVKQMAKSTSGIVFLGTPHRGSPIAKWKQHMQMILSPSIEVKEMEEGEPKLLDLHNRFMNCLHSCFSNAKVVSIAEGTPTMLTSFKFPLRIVTEESARIDYGDFYVLKDDHLSLSKPIFRQSFLYQRLLQAIDEAVHRQYRPETTEELPMTSEESTVSGEIAEMFSDVTDAVKGIFKRLPQIKLNILDFVSESRNT